MQKAVDQLKKLYPSAASNISGHAYNMANEEILEKNIVSLLDDCGGKLDHIIWTAGDPLAIMPINEVDMTKLKQAGMTRYFGPVLLGKHAPKYLNAGPGSSITFTTGSVSQKPLPGWSAIGGYATALHGLTRGLALDLKPIRVNLVSPGAVATDLWAGLPEDVREQRFKAFAEGAATGEVGQVVDVVETYLYLLKDRNVTGSIVSSNSGALIM